MPITKTDLQDADIIDAAELASDGAASYLTLTVVSTTAGTKVVVVGLAPDGEGILNGRDHPVEVGDTVVLTGTSGGAGDGTFTVASVTDDTTFVVVEAIGTSTGGSATFIYPVGAGRVGFDPAKQAATASNVVQQVVTDLANHELLDSEPVGTGVTYLVTRTSGVVTQEKWSNTGNSRTIKTIDYTYSSGKVTTEIRKVFSTADGTTVIAQVTQTYAYSGNNVTGSTITRDV